MPGPAAVWLTSNPAAPALQVPVEMASPDDPEVRFSHTLAAGEVLRGDFATSEGRYQRSAFWQCVFGHAPHSAPPGR